MACSRKTGLGVLQYNAGAAKTIIVSQEYKALCLFPLKELLAVTLSPSFSNVYLLTPEKFIELGNKFRQNAGGVALGGAGGQFSHISAIETPPPKS